MKLRPYQNKTIAELRAGFKINRRQVLALPTGAGKTVIFSEIVYLAAERGTKCLVVTDRIELFKQTFRALRRTGITPQEITAKRRADVDADAVVSVAMVETVKRRIVSGKISLKPELIIIDEAHKRNFDAIIDLFPTSLVIGATATPIGAQFHKYYSGIVSTIDIPELVEKGYLSKCRAYEMQEDLSDLKTRAGEYTASSLNEHYNKKGLFDGVVAEYIKKAAGKKTLVFNVSIEHTLNMTEAFRAAGIEAEALTSNTPPEEREDILKRFKEGSFPVLNNCGILTTGYDEPSIETIIVNRATKSLALWLQMVGRGSRTFKNKAEFLVLDFGLNHTRHGLWQQPRVWKIEPPKKRSDVKDVAPVKSCPNCEAIIFATAKACEFCDYVFPVEAAKLREGVLIEVTNEAAYIGKKISEVSLTDLADLQKAKRFSHHYIWRVVRSKGVESLREYAQLMKYSGGWIIRQKKDLHNSAFVNVRL